MNRRLYGESHPEGALSLGDLQEAKALATAALEIQPKVLGTGHPSVGSMLAILGRWEMEDGNIAAAEERLREALAIQQAVLTPDHPDLAITRVDLAETLLLTGNSQEALVQAQMGETSLLKSLSESHWITAVARHAHGAALQAVGDINAAEPLLRSSYEQLAADPAARPAFVDKARVSLLSIYDALGMTAEASRYRVQ